MKRWTTLVTGAAALAALAAHAGIELNFPKPPGPGATDSPAAAQLPEAEDFGLLELANGEQFKVRLERYDPAEGLLTVRHPLMRGPVQVEDSAILRFSAQPTRLDENPPPGLLATLTDGDRIRGEEFTIDAERVRFKTIYGADVALPRAALRSLSAGGPRLLYEGPSNGEAWTIGGSRAILESAMLSLRNNEIAARQLPAMPRKLRLDFTLAGSFYIQSLSVYFHANRVGGPQSNNVSGYQLTISTQSRSTLSRLVPGQGAQTVGTSERNLQAQMQRMAAGLPISIFSDLDAQEVRVFVDGRPAMEFKDSGRLQNPGRVLAFSSTQPVTLAGLRVSQWDGKPPAAETAGDDTADALFLKTGDTLSGELLELRRGQVSLRSAMGDLTIPMGQVDRIRLRGAAAAPPENRPGIRIQLLDGSALMLVVEKIEDGVLSGRSGLAGVLRIPVKAVGQAVWRGEAATTAPEEPRGAAGGEGPRGQGPFTF